MSRLPLVETPTSEPPDADIPEGTHVTWLDNSNPAAPRLETKIRIDSITIRRVRLPLVP